MRHFVRGIVLVLIAGVLASSQAIHVAAVSFDRGELDPDQQRQWDIQNGVYFVGGANCTPTTGISTPENPGTTPNGTGAPTEDYTRVIYGGKTVNKRTVEMMKTAESKLGGKPLTLTQGSYNAGGVAASAGTHDGGGAIDVNINGLDNTAILAIVKALREAGFAAWQRGINNDGFSPHIHAIAIGDAEMSSGAAAQVKDYFAGKNGLAGGGEDPNKDIGRPIPEWAKKYGTGTDPGTTTASPNTVCCPTGNGDGVVVDISQVDGDTGKQAFVYLIQKGLTADQAAGVLGNLMAESGGQTLKLDPKLVNGNGAYGIVQWMGGRKSKLQKKPNYDTIQVQMDYLWEELSSDYKSSVLDPLKSAANRETAVQIFLERYEIPCLPGPNGTGCLAEYNKRLTNANNAYKTLSGLSSGAVASVANSGNCQQAGGAGGSVNVDGYVWPLQIANKADMYNGGGEYKLPCTKCHHDGTAAFDLANKGYSDPANVGTVAVAITAGKIAQVKVDRYNGGCSSIQFLGDDGYYYWYGHTLVNESTPAVGTHVEAGTPISKIGPPRCNNGGAAHLHIDRGAPKGHTGGEVCCRDPGFIEVMNNIYNKTPSNGGASPL